MTSSTEASGFHDQEGSGSRFFARRGRADCPGCSSASHRCERSPTKASRGAQRPRRERDRNVQRVAVEYESLPQRGGSCHHEARVDRLALPRALQELGYLTMTRVTQPAKKPKRLSTGAANGCAKTFVGNSERHQSATPTTPGCSTWSISLLPGALPDSCSPTAR